MTNPNDTLYSIRKRTYLIKKRFGLVRVYHNYITDNSTVVKQPDPCGHALTVFSPLIRYKDLDMELSILFLSLLSRISS